jgi:hypothetical protein
MTIFDWLGAETERVVLEARRQDASDRLWPELSAVTPIVTPGRFWVGVDQMKKGNGGKTRGDQRERSLARISSGKGGMSWQPGTFSRAPR